MVRTTHWWWPVQFRVEVTLFVLTLLAAGVCLAPLFDWQPGDWSRLDQLMRERSLLIAAPLLVIAASAGRVVHRGRLPFAAEADRDRGLITGRFVTRMMVPAAIGEALAIVVALVRVSTSANAGHVSIWTLVGTMAGTLSAIPLGFALGASLPGFAWPLTTLLVGCGVLLAPLAVNELLLVNTGLSSRSLSLMWGLAIPEPGWEPVAAIGVIRLVYFVLLGLAATLAFAQLSGRQGGRAPLRAATLLLIPVAALAVTVSQSPRLNLVVPTDEPLACDSVPAASSSTQVCLQQVHVSLLPSVAGLAGSMLAVPPDRPIETITEDSTAAPSNGTLVIASQLPASRAAYIDATADHIAAALTGAAACQQRSAAAPEQGTNAALPTAIDLDGAVRQRLASLAGATPIPAAVSDQTGEPVLSSGYPSLAKLDVHQFTDWYRAHSEPIRTCTLTDRDMP